MSKCKTYTNYHDYNYELILICHKFVKVIIIIMTTNYEQRFVCHKHLFYYWILWLFAKPTLSLKLENYANSKLGQCFTFQCDATHGLVRNILQREEDNKI